MKRNLDDIRPVRNPHNEGKKRILVSSDETGCNLSQIAITDYKTGDVSTSFIHAPKKEGLFVLEGELEITINGEIDSVIKGDFLYFTPNTEYTLRATTNARVITIACGAESVKYNKQKSPPPSLISGLKNALSKIIKEK